ncbi:MAG: nicotinate (nicotinamide) nucleotide adenylyltransferase [Thermoanaerobaculia bacterium]|nr:MAG: nicotinate (nicotinamide) nucleotide adenylyltransferase [Thermoanaerobaculia bacterium]
MFRDQRRERGGDRRAAGRARPPAGARGVRVGLFGGSFDPVHRGHVETALAARRDLGLERVLFVPTAQPPHKPERRFAPALARYAMVELALLDLPELEVWDVELAPGRPAYTIETLERFAAERPRDEPVLVLGSDALAALDTWRRWSEILELARLAVVERPGAARAAVLAGIGAGLAGRLASARVEWVTSAPHPASASEIRRRLGAGEPVPEGWLDPRVLKFVHKYRLYR